MERSRERVGIGHLVGMSPGFLSEIQKIPLMARCASCVLITGEPGTGKETCARTIHHLSDRADGPFVAVDCGVPAGERAESELLDRIGIALGRPAGSAARTLPGPQGGTLFLDEVHQLPQQVQVKLLAWIREVEWQARGLSWDGRPQTRVIGALSVDPRECVRSGQLTKDLYARLSVLSLRMPALRHRREDIPLLARHFVTRFCRAMKRPPLHVSSGGLRKLQLHDWPGNAAELERLIERAVALCRGDTLIEEDLQPESLESWETAESFQDAKARCVQDFEKRFIEKLLVVHEGNISRAARSARKDRRAFWELIRKHGIDADRYRLSAEALGRDPR